MGTRASLSQISGPAQPTAVDHLARKDYVDSKVAAGASSTALSYVGDVPAGAAGAAITVTHGLGTADVNVSVRETSTGLWVPVANQTTGTNTLDLTFASAVTAGQYRVYVVAATGTSSTIASDVANLRTQMFGSATRTAKPFCYGWMVNNVSVPAGADTYLRYDNFSVRVDSDSHFSAEASTGLLRWTCQVPGWYRGRFATRWDIADTSGIRICYGALNGTSSSFMRKKELPAWAPNSSEGDTIIADGYGYINAGDYLRFGVYHNANSTRSWWNNSFSTPSDVTMEFVRP